MLLEVAGWQLKNWLGFISQKEHRLPNCRRLRAFKQIALTVITTAKQIQRHLTPL